LSFADLSVATQKIEFVDCFRKKNICECNTPLSDCENRPRKSICIGEFMK